MRNNHVFAGTLEKRGGQHENNKQTVKDFLHNQMKIPEEAVKNVTFRPQKIMAVPVLLRHFIACGYTAMTRH